MDKTPEQLYQERLQRIMDAYALKKPDRVPVFTNYGPYAQQKLGISKEEEMMDLKKSLEASFQATLYYDPDVFGHIMTLGPVLAPLDFKQMKWAGHGLPANSGWQWIEMECMKAEEYDEFIYDPSDFIVRKYWPRAYGKLGALSMMPPLREAQGYFAAPAAFMAFGTEEGQAALDALKEAGRAAFDIIMGFVNQTNRMKDAGYPPLFGGISGVPFDLVGDFLRGRKGIMLDMYRRPDKLIQAAEKMLPMAVEMGLKQAKMSGCPIVFIAIHGGVEGFMSVEQYKRFYWPTLREAMVRLIEGGCYPFVLVEGRSNSRLEIMADVPPGKVCYWFEQVDMAKAAEVMKGKACIAGNVPLTLLSTGTPDEVKAYCKNLIDTVGKDGGFIMGPGGDPIDAKIENIKAMIDFTKEYGAY
jgi:uroporphyrinogen-III decarboxylase